MPAYLDICGLTNERNKQLIEKFLREYIYREKIEDRGDEDLMILKLEYHQNPSGKNDDNNFDWEPAKTLTNTIKRGLDYPRRCFYVCYPSDHEIVNFAWLQFTTDDKLILGLSVSIEKESNLVLSKSLLNHLKENYHCHLGMITD